MFGSVVGGRSRWVVVEAPPGEQGPEPAKLIVRCRVAPTDVVKTHERSAGRQRHEVLVLQWRQRRGDVGQLLGHGSTPKAAARVAVEAEQRAALALQALADPGRFAPEELGDLLGRQAGLLELAPPQHARDERRACGAVGVETAGPTKERPGADPRATRSGSLTGHDAADRRWLILVRTRRAQAVLIRWPRRVSPW